MRCPEAKAPCCAAFPLNEVTASLNAAYPLKFTGSTVLKLLASDEKKDRRPIRNYGIPLSSTDKMSKRNENQTFSDTKS